MTDIVPNTTTGFQAATLINQAFADIITNASSITYASASIVTLNSITGSLANLTTTSKTNLVSAVNELVTRTNVTLETSGSLKLSQVELNVSSPNLAFDPLNRYYAPSTSAQDGRVRWYYTPGNMSQVNPDAGNPFGLPTTRVSVSGGKKLYLSEMGVRVGDIISLGVLAMAPATRVFKVNYTFRTGGGTIISSVTGTSRTGDSTIRLYSELGITIPATCEIIDIYPIVVSGTGDVDVYSWYLVKGYVISVGIVNQGNSDGQRSLGQVIDANGTDSNLKTRIERFPNLPLNDPFAMLYPVSTISQDDYIRWYTPANITRILGDTNNPFGLNTLRITPNASHRFLLSELGISVGDILSFGIIGNWSPGTAYEVGYSFRNSSAVVTGGGTASGSGLMGSGTPQFIKYESSGSVPATSVFLDVYPARPSGSGTIDVYGTFITKSTTISGSDCFLYGYTQKEELGTLAFKNQTLPPEMNLANLSSWREAQANIYETSGSNMKIAFLGDSITNLYTRYFKPLTARLASDVGGGQGGVGFISVNSTAYNALVGMPMFTSVSRSGSWTDHDVGSTPIGQGYDMYDALCTVTGGSYTVVAEMSDFNVHFINDPAGGTFRYRIDSGSWVGSYSTAGATSASVISITGMDGNSHTIDIGIDLAPVTLSGFEAIDNTVSNGIITLKGGYSGANTGHWVAASNQATWREALAYINPKLVVVWLGTNNSGISSTYKANLLTIATNIRTALPNVSILFVSPYEAGVAHSYEWHSYADRIRELSNENNYIAGLDMGAYISYAKNPDIFTDTTHINSVGGTLAAGAIFRALKW